MIILANKEVYRLDIKVGVSGDSESKNKLTAVEKMTQQIEKKTKALSKITANATAKLKDEASSKIERLESKVNKLKSTSMTLTAKIKDEASSTVDKIQSKTKKIKQANVVVKAKDEASKVITGIENKINGWIKTGAKKVISIGTAGVIAAGGIGLGTSIKTYSEYEKGLSNVKAVTNATNSQMEQLDAAAKKFGSTTAWSARHVTQAEELLGQAGFSVNETISALPGLLNLASAGDLDLASATDIASGTLRAFNINASQSGHVADVLALSASATNSDVSDLGETMKYVAPVSQALGISLEDTAAAAGLLSNANIKGSQAGTVLRQTMARLASPTKDAADMMSMYGINAFDAHGNMKPLSDVVDNLNGSLGKLTSQKRADVISTIFGTESMSGVLALMNQGGKSVSELSRQLKDANGAAQKMSDTKLDNLQGQWIKLKAAVEHMQITLGEKLAPYAKQFVTWLTGKMPTITDKIVEMVDYVSKHTEEIKSLAEIVIGLGAAFTALSVAGKIGNTISGISSLVGIFKGAKISTEIAEAAGEISKLGVVGKLLPAIFTPAGLAIAASVALIGTATVAQSNLMKKSVTTTTEELGPMEKVMNALNGHINKSKKEMVEAGLIYDDFGEGISDSFKKGAQDASKSLLGIEMDINRLTNSGNMDESSLNKLKNYVNDYAYESINAMKDQKSKIQGEFQKTFSIDGVTSDTEQKVMDSLNTYFETGINKELDIRDGIYQFASDKIKEHGTLLDEDLKEIQDRLAKAKALELEYTKAQNAYDAEYSKNQFTNDASRVTGIDGASELLQNRAKDHQDSLDKIENNYQGTLAYYDSLLSNTDLSDQQREDFQKGKDEAGKARDEALKKAQLDWKSDLETLYKAYPQAQGMFNEKTGAKFSDEDIVAHKGTDYLKSHFQNLDQVTQEGWYRIKNTTSGEMEDIYATVDKDTGEINGAWSKTAGWSGGYTDELKQKVKELGETHESERVRIQNSLSTLTGSTLDSNNQVISSTGDVIGQLKGVQGATDGAITGIIDINGTHMQITSNASGQITTMQQYKGSIDDIPPDADVHINSNASNTISDMQKVKEEVNSVDGKAATVTINTVFSGVATSLGQVLGNGAVNAASEVIKNIPQHYNGTDNAESGINSVGERGMELVLGRRLYNFKGGEKVLNNSQTVNLLKARNKQDNEPFQVKQGQYKLAQPQQVQVVGGNGNSIQVDVQVNSGNQDVEKLIVEVTYEVGRKLKEALINIKK
ncbi:phage tail tape measure protein [Clostridium beijerinckii]|uniref:phage tail tape measure protein n=1 Tax=Clostridium beijerinckii TaxID=1520 RepID=UPI0009D5B128|nr:phage tail tape measure protein [Clostridium beijerinckii]MBA8937264.1 TP901 family phage tail tape measure protein [Clostridium beijerinckii]NRU40270.1 TP901 family phage tail tape measure protein [Clostridium beijerinckii]NSA96453.1 TP901 family phage tail tape measure protein [Clostridium beijerinckii]OOM60641.1 phage-related minor tail protein [Clostridium beijerinckii]OOM68563.1 phage-related minor tail protein [Clostridium beijerinckii]